MTISAAILGALRLPFGKFDYQNWSRKSGVDAIYLEISRNPKI